MVQPTGKHDARPHALPVEHLRYAIPVECRPGAAQLSGHPLVENDGVGLGKIGPAGQKYADQVQEITDQIAAGEIKDIPDTVK